MLLYSRRTERLTTSCLRMRRVSSWAHLIFPSSSLFSLVEHEPPTTEGALTRATRPLPPPTRAARPPPLAFRRRRRLPVQPRSHHPRSPLSVLSLSRSRGLPLVAVPALTRHPGTTPLHPQLLAAPLHPQPPGGAPASGTGEEDPARCVCPM
jgi:hypothetical protein